MAKNKVHLDMVVNFSYAMDQALIKKHLILAHHLLVLETTLVEAYYV